MQVREAVGTIGKLFFLSEKLTELDIGEIGFSEQRTIQLFGSLPFFLPLRSLDVSAAGFVPTALSLVAIRSAVRRVKELRCAPPFTAASPTRE